MQGASGQYARYNNRNITLVNNASRIVDRGPYVPPPAAELQNRSGDVGKVLLQFEGASVLGAALIVAGGFTAMDAAAWLAYTYLEKHGEGQVTAGTTRNVGGGEATPEQVLDAAEKYLGPGYKEISPGVFRSADRTNQFRMTDSDLTDPKQGPHVHFEYIGPDGKQIIENSHVRLIDPPKGKP